MSAKPAAANAAREHVLGAEVEEHRADVRGDAGVGDREDLGPAAVAAAHPRRPRPPCRRAASTRRISRSARTGSGTYMSPRPQTAASKLASAKGSSSASARSKRTLPTPRCDGDAARRLDHLARDVGADDRAARAHQPRPCAKADQPGAAGDVEHTLARPQARHVEHQRNEPARAGRASRARRPPTARSQP